MASAGGYPATYRCSLGTNAVPGLARNGLLAVLPDDGAENWSLIWPPGSPKVVLPDCPFDILSASSSGSARRLLIVSGLTGWVVNAQAPDAPDRKATIPAPAISILFIEPPPRTNEMIVGHLAGLSSPLSPMNLCGRTEASEDGVLAPSRPKKKPSMILNFASSVG